MLRTASIVLVVLSLVAGGCANRHKTKEELYSEGMKAIQANKPGNAIIYFKNALEKDQNYQDARFQLAKAYYSIGKYEAAEIELEKVLRQLPGSREVHIEIARVYVQNGKPDNALKEIAGLTGDVENDIEVMEIAGWAHAQKRNYPTAITLLKKVAASQPERSTAVFMLSRVYLLTGDLQSARAQVDGLLRTEPSNRNALLLLAEIQTRTKDAESAFKTYDEILKNSPADSEAMFKKGMLYIDQGRADEAIVLSATIIKNFEHRPEGYELRGFAFYHKKQFTDAIVAFQKAVSIRPRTSSYYFLALCHFNSGEPEQAMNQLQRALDLNPSFAQARVLMSLIHLRKGKLNDSVSEIKRALALDDENAYAHSVLGSAYLAKGMSSEGLAELNRALELDPNLIDAYLKKGAFELGRGKTREGEAELAAAVRIDPDLLTSRIMLASSYLKRNEYAKAIETARQGMRNQKTDAVLYNIIADALLRQRKRTDAISALQKAKEADPGYEISYFKLAALHRLAGDQAKALEELKTLADRSPASAQAQLTLAALYENQGKEKEARECYERARKTGTPAAAIEVVRYFLRRQQFDTAIQTLDEAIQKNPSAPALLLMKGEVFLGQKKYDDAVRTFEDLAKINAAAGFPAVVNAYIAMNKPEKALERIQREIKNSPERPELKAELSRIYVVMGKTPEAVENARQMIRKQPETAAGYLTLAMVYQSTKEPEKGIDALKSASHLRDVNITMMLGNLNAAVKNYPVALQYYQKAESIKQGYVPAIFQQAAVLHTMGKKKEAIAGYQRVVTLSENYVPALNNLAYLYAEDRSALATALQYAVRAYVLAPKEGSVQDTLGFVLLKNGKPEEGLKALKLAEAALPNNPAVHYHLALAYKELNQSSAAAEHLQKAISLGDFPEQREARAMLAQLKNTEERAGR